VSTVSTLYGSSGQSITITLNSLANGSFRQSTVISNTTNLYLDVLLQFKVKTGASGVSTTGVVRCYLYASADGGSDYTDGASGSDGSFTPTSPPNQRVVMALNCVANATVYTSDLISVAAAYGGVLPAEWGIVIENETGAALDSSAGGTAWYQGIQQTVA
jgi:hypothetical protein